MDIRWCGPEYAEEFRKCEPRGLGAVRLSEKAFGENGRRLASHDREETTRRPGPRGRAERLMTSCLVAVLRCPALETRVQMIAIRGAAAFSSPAASLASGRQDNGR